MPTAAIDPLFVELRRIAGNASGRMDPDLALRVGELLAEVERRCPVNVREKVEALEHSFDHLLGVQRGAPPGGLTWAEWVDHDVGVIRTIVRLQWRRHGDGQD